MLFAFRHTMITVSRATLRFATFAFLVCPSVAGSATMMALEQNLEHPDTPLVFAVTRPEVIGFGDYLHFVASHETSAQFEGEIVSSIGDYELLPYEPRDAFDNNLPAADDHDEDRLSAGFVVYTNPIGFQLADALLQLPQFRDNRIPWESLFVWSPPSAVRTDIDEIVLVILDRNQMRLRNRQTPEPASLMFALPGLLLVGLYARKRLRKRAQVGDLRWLENPDNQDCLNRAAYICGVELAQEAAGGWRRPQISKFRAGQSWPGTFW